MPETSGPRITGTAAERQMDDLLWRDMFGSEAGVVGDIDGSAYKLTLPSSSNTVQVGSTTQPSLSIVGGFRHRISAGETEGVDLSPVVGGARTDIIAARLDLAGFTGAPGPVRLVGIEGTSTSLPAFDDAAPGVEDLPLWSLTRQPGQALSQAQVKRLFSRLAPVLEVPPDASLPLNSPLGTVAYWQDNQYRRELSAQSVPVWKRKFSSAIIGTYDAPFANPAGSFGEPHSEITKFTIPDPGIPFRPQITMGFEAGSTQSGTRWDFHAGYGGSGAANAPLGTILTPNYRVGLENIGWISATGVIGPVLSGQQTYRIVASRVYGGAQGSITAYNRIFRVNYWVP